jgi:hypothetical protein
MQHRDRTIKLPLCFWTAGDREVHRAQILARGVVRVLVLRQGRNGSELRTHYAERRRPELHSRSHRHDSWSNRCRCEVRESV